MAKHEFRPAVFLWKFNQTTFLKVFEQLRNHFSSPLASGWPKEHVRSKDTEREAASSGSLSHRKIITRDNVGVPFFWNFYQTISRRWVPIVNSFVIEVCRHNLSQGRGDEMRRLRIPSPEFHLRNNIIIKFRISVNNVPESRKLCETNFLPFFGNLCSNQFRHMLKPIVSHKNCKRWINVSRKSQE